MQVKEYLSVKYDSMKQRRVELANTNADKQRPVIRAALQTAVFAKGKVKTNDSLEVLKILVENGCWGKWYLKVLAKDQGITWVPAKHSSSHVHFPKGKLLVKIIQDKSAVTTERLLSVFKIFIDHGMDWKTWRHKDIVRLVDNAVRFGHEELLAALVESGLPRQTGNSQHVSMVSIAKLTRHAKCTEDILTTLLGIKHPDPAVKWNYAFMASMSLIYGGRQELVDFLREYPVNHINSLCKRVHPGHSQRGEMCSICWEDFKCGNKIVTLGCKHSYCHKCILQVAQSNNCECPYCRQAYV